MPSGVLDSLNVAVIGTGYVGLTTGVALAFLGHNVCAMDKDEQKIEMLCSGKSPIHERGLESLLSSVKDNICFTTDMGRAVQGSDVILIAVGTPSRDDGQADMRFVEKAASEVANSMKDGESYIVIVKSTVPVGSNRQVRLVMDGVLAERGLHDRVALCVASNPEFLREGTALHDTIYPDRIVAGAERSDGVEAIRKLYRPILEQTFDPPEDLPRPEGYTLPSLVTTDPASAELIKYAANAFLAMKISYINEIAGLCERVGADVTEVARGMGLDSRISAQFLRAGLGWGGSCFPKDTSALAAMGTEHSYPMPLVEAARIVNVHQRGLVIEKLQAQLKGLRGRRICVLGLSFKPGTDDVRESPAIDVIQQLVAREAHVRAHDPVALHNAKPALEDLGVELCDRPYDAAGGTDAIVLATEWSEYRVLDLRRLAAAMRTPILVDARNLLSREDAESAGFRYVGVGR